MNILQRKKGRFQKMNANQLMASILDSLDRRLVNQGFEFREDGSWHAFSKALEKLIFQYYEDHVGEDADFVPGDSPQTASEEDDDIEEDDDESETLGSQDTEE